MELSDAEFDGLLQDLKDGGPAVIGRTDFDAWEAAGRLASVLGAEVAGEACLNEVVFMASLP